MPDSDRTNPAVDAAVDAAIRRYYTTGEKDYWHASPGVDVHILRDEEDECVIRWYAYHADLRPDSRGFINTDTSRLLGTGIVPPAPQGDDYHPLDNADLDAWGAQVFGREGE